jgi:hypothetical protein
MRSYAWLAAACAAILFSAPGCLSEAPPRVLWQDQKLSSPVVVIESDDWGVRNWNRDQYGRITDAEHANAVRQLADVLRRHHDSVGRPAVLSAFVIVGEADLPAILADTTGGYHWRPIDQTSPAQVAALKQAERDGVFAIHYHGRDHFDNRLFCVKVHQAGGATTCPDPTPAVLRSVFGKCSQRDRDRLMAEYFDSRSSYLGPPLHRRAAIPLGFRGGNPVEGPRHSVRAWRELPVPADRAHQADQLTPRRFSHSQWPPWPCSQRPLRFRSRRR